MDDDDIPILTDLIEEKIDITEPEINLDVDQDIFIDDDDEDIDLFPASNREPENPALEQTIRRILDEHMELAWQEIRMAIQLAQEDDDSNN